MHNWFISLSPRFRELYFSTAVLEKSIFHFQGRKGYVRVFSARAADDIGRAGGRSAAVSGLARPVAERMEGLVLLLIFAFFS